MTPSAAVHAHPARRAVFARAVHARSSTPVARPNGPRLAVVLESIGYLVPRVEFRGRVHSVFAHACNLAAGGTLLTVHAGSDAPATLRLARATRLDLRNHFEVGEAIDCRDG